MNPGAEWLKKEEVANWLQVSTKTIDRWAQEGRFPSPRRFTARTLRWPRSVVEEFQKKFTAKPA